MFGTKKKNFHENKLESISCSGEGCLSTIISTGILGSPEDIINRVNKLDMKINIFPHFVSLPQSNLQTTLTLKTYFNSITWGKYPGYWIPKKVSCNTFPWYTTSYSTARESKWKNTLSPLWNWIENPVFPYPCAIVCNSFILCLVWVFSSIRNGLSV